MAPFRPHFWGERVCSNSPHLTHLTPLASRPPLIISGYGNVSKCNEYCKDRHVDQLHQMILLSWLLLIDETQRWMTCC